MKRRRSCVARHFFTPPHCVCIAKTFASRGRRRLKRSAPAFIFDGRSFPSCSFQLQFSWKEGYPHCVPLPVLSVAQMREWEQASWDVGCSEAEVISRVGQQIAKLALELTS